MIFKQALKYLVSLKEIISLLISINNNPLLNQELLKLFVSCALTLRES